MPEKPDVLQGTLALMVLKTLARARSTAMASRAASSRSAATFLR
jgi:hypothetical protein